jgi:hypothetical protein
MEANYLIIGKIPLDVKMFLDYLRIVEVDMKKSDEQSMEILSYNGKDLNLIKSNHWYFMSNHKCQNRVSSLSEILISHE